MQQIRDAVSSRDNSLKVLIEYTDTTGERRSVEKDVPIQFRSADSSTPAAGARGQQKPFIGSTTFWISIIAIIVVGFVVYIRRTRRKKRPKDNAR